MKQKIMEVCCQKSLCSKTSKTYSKSVAHVPINYTLVTTY